MEKVIMRAIYKFMLFFLCLSCFTVVRASEMPLIEQVVTNDLGVCLLIGDSWLVTKGMQASNEGMFVLMNEEWMSISEAVELGDYQASWKCSKCGRYNMDGVNTCPYCGKPKNG